MGYLSYDIIGGNIMNNQYFYPNFNPGYMRAPMQMMAPTRAISGIAPAANAFSASAPSAGSLLGGLSRAPSLGAISSAGTAAKSFSWTGLLNGASKTLGVINQAIPVVYQVKPIWNNAKTMFRVVKELNKSDAPSTSSMNYTESTSSTTNSTNASSSTSYNSNNSHNNNDDLPTFFH